MVLLAENWILNFASFKVNLQLKQMHQVGFNFEQAKQITLKIKLKVNYG
jgi:hypothetical protein